MATSSVTSATNVAQQLQPNRQQTQARETPNTQTAENTSRPREAEASKRPERSEQAQRDQQAQQQQRSEQSKPVVNVQGQKTGTIINTTA